MGCTPSFLAVWVVKGHQTVYRVLFFLRTFDIMIDKSKEPTYVILRWL
jgi:hypothetical protein